MRILILEPDPNFRQLVRRSLEGDGHEVVVSSQAEMALGFYRMQPHDLVICALEPGNVEGATLMRQIRGQGTPMVIATSAFFAADDPEVQEVTRAFNPSLFLPKPLSLLELGDRIRALAQGRSARGRHEPAGASLSRPPPRPMSRRGVDQRNLMLLTRLWATRASGVLAVSGVDELSSGWASLSRGGPVDGESRGLLEGAMYGGDLSFEPSDVTTPGDWEAMGQILWKATYDPAQRRFLTENRFQALARTAASGLALQMPISPGSRRLLALADGATTLGEICAREGIDPEQVSPEIFALRQLRLLALQSPVARRPSEATSGAAASEPARREEEHRSGTPSVTTGSGLRRPGAVDPASFTGLRVEAAPRGVDTQRTGATPPTGAVGHRPVLDSTRTLPPGRRPGTEPPTTGRPPLSGASVGGGSAAGPALGSAMGSAVGSAGIGARAQMRQVMLRLKREATDLEAASPAVVLSIPSDASPELVHQAAERMRSRYRQIVQDPTFPHEAKTLAAQVLERVDEAEKNWGRGGARSAVAVDEDTLLNFGREAISQRNWDIAEKVLTRARQIRTDNASVLANLAWAHLSNPRHAPEERVREARDLLSLAEQFDPRNAEGQHYYAELLFRIGEYAACLVRAERAVKAAPDNQAAALLLRRVKQRLGPEGPAGR